MMAEETLVGRRVKTFYHDGEGVNCRIGVVSSVDKDFLIIENSVLIPRERIVRVEVQP